MKPIIEVQQLAKAYKKKSVLDNISFQVTTGEIVALLGENGAGKSTLIHLLNHLISKDSGSISIMGTQDITSVRENISVMLQNNLSLNKITVKEILNLSRSYYKHPLSYSRLIDLADLKTKEHHYLDQLSGGQKRKLTFAAAMAGDPKLVFLDEPTAGMDSESRTNFWGKIAEFKNLGKTFFVISHYLEELENIADHVMILKDTHLIYDGNLQNLRHATGQLIISFTTNLPRETFAGFSAITKLINEGHRFRLLTNHSNLVLEALAPFFSHLENLTVQQSSLESLYMEVIKE